MCQLVLWDGRENRIQVKEHPIKVRTLVAVAEGKVTTSLEMLALVVEAADMAL
jgi:hypothetical protein